MPDWTGLSCGSGIQGSGLNAGPAGDKTGLFPWREGPRWGVGWGPSLLSITNKALHKTPAASGGLRKLFSSRYGTPRPPLPQITTVSACLCPVLSSLPTLGGSEQKLQKSNFTSSSDQGLLGPTQTNPNKQHIKNNWILEGRGFYTFWGHTHSGVSGV